MKNNVIGPTTSLEDGGKNKNKINKMIKEQAHDKRNDWIIINNMDLDPTTTKSLYSFLKKT